jgi:7,8-dihydropterin-6-yl-methyl-4-(beta-D-ribofuranosyl)aminobenzene 5'-phosphate synthase
MVTLIQLSLIILLSYLQINMGSEFLMMKNLKITAGAAKADSVKITVLYDNYVYSPGTKADWGFSCLIEGLEKTILFDTGGNGEILLSNVDSLHIDLHRVEQLVLSHNHGDHTGGLKAVLAINPLVKVFIPLSFPEDFGKTYHIQTLNRVDRPCEICRDVFLTGEMGTQIKEQSLIIDTKKGLVIIAGCAHQGIVAILRKALSIVDRDIYLVMGGFHLLRSSDTDVHAIIREFKTLGVQNCGGTHCTGDEQIQMFRSAYGENYISMGTGRILTITDTGLKLN